MNRTKGSNPSLSPEGTPRLIPVWKKGVLPFLFVGLGGLLATALAWILYLGIYLGLESLFYAEDPQSFPADSLRTGCALAFLGIYLLLSRSRLSPLLQSCFFAGSMTTLLITVVLDFYSKPFLAVPVYLGILGLATVILIGRKRPWFFYWALAYSVGLSLWYAWPR